MAVAALLAAACSGGEAEPPQATERPAATSTPPIAPSTGSDAPAERDLVDLARRFRGLIDPPRMVQLPTLAAGATQEFELLILPSDPDDRPERTTAQATLRSVSEHAYFFVEDGADVDAGEVAEAVRAFEEEVWPAVVGNFGPPPSPGVDGDPRIVLLHADLGSAVAGYVNGDDGYPQEVVPTSNGRESIYLDLDVSLGSMAYTGVLAHELQHVIHQGLDAGEEAWVNEGLSVFAAGLVGSPSSYGAYLERPQTQLNTWSALDAGGAHYAASGLFFEYLFEQTGGEARRLAAEPADGVAGVRAFLAALGEPRSFEALAADWAVANYLDQPGGAYGYQGVDVGPPETKRVEGTGEEEGEVGQFGVDYLEFEAGDFSGPPAVIFTGEAQTPALAAQLKGDAGSFWWSGRGDNIDSMLTRELDLTGVESATLTFRTWFDIERWYDFGYVAASRDGGLTWDVLEGEESTSDDPLAVSYGPGYSGRSGGGGEPEWIDERIDLSAYAGSRVLLRFELVNDESQHGDGWAIDDIAVPEIGFFDDAEADAGGWQRQGFRRLSEPLAQRFQLRLITLGAVPAVEEIELDGGNQARIALDGLGSEYSKAIIVIMATTEGTTEPARYRYEVLETGESG
ncbi:MAG: immune inhibitor A [Chloroflexi bacterium]|nr:immune inhibitor A [Chloroflexota bacterium]